MTMVSSLLGLDKHGLIHGESHWALAAIIGIMKSLAYATLTHRAAPRESKH